MKLIRLATDNDGKFDVNFDTSLRVEPNSSMALYNLTVEPEFVTFEIGPSNEELIVSYPTQLFATGNNTNIPRIVLDTIEEKDNFLLLLSQAFNGTLFNHSFNTVGETSDPQGPAEWRVGENAKNRKMQIELQLATVLPPFENFTGITGDPGIFTFDGDIYDAHDQLSGGPSIGDRFSLGGGRTTVTDRSYILEMTEGVSFPRGCGTMVFQIEDSNDNGLGGGFPVTNNGFGFGVCLGVDEIPKDANGLLADADVDFEMYYNRNTENYSMIAGKGNARSDTGVAPLKVRLAGNPQASRHDIMGITLEGNLLFGFVAQDNATNFTPLGIQTLTEAQLLAIQEKGIKAYMYASADNTNIKICNARCSASPYCEDGPLSDPDTGLFVATTSLGGRDVSIGGLTDELYEDLPLTMNPDNENLLGNERHELIFSIRMDLDLSIQRFLGIPRTDIIRSTEDLDVVDGELKIVCLEKLQFTYNDFYLVESQTLPLDSYNCVPDERLSDLVNQGQALRVPLKGDRKNILATIPLQQGTGEMVYEVNTPIFIDIKNLSDSNIRNLKFRILDNNFQEIKTSNTSNMTLLIKGPKE